MAGSRYLPADHPRESGRQKCREALHRATPPPATEFLLLCLSRLCDPQHSPLFHSLRVDANSTQVVPTSISRIRLDVAIITHA
jgi:hypothetical protein